MSDRLTLTQPVYMPVQGQWVIVYGGSVLDLPSAAVIHQSHKTNVLVGGGGTLVNGQTTPVSTYRTM